MSPPKWAIKFLSWFCPDELLEGVLGDLLEQFEEYSREQGVGRAKRIFIWNVIRLFHPSIILRNHLKLQFMHMGMLKSHLVVAGRNMLKNKFYSFINILGLSAAIAFIFLAFLFIQNERSFDQFHTKKDSIFRVYQDIVNEESGQSKQKSAVTAVPLAKDLATQFPAITQFSRYASSTGTMYKGDKPFDETFHFVDADFLNMFDFPMMDGSIPTALDDPGDILLSVEMAEKYFGEQDPVGQSVQLSLNDSTINLTVSGVIDARREKSSIPFDFLMPIEQYKLVIPERMFNSHHYGLLENYVQLEANTKQADIEPLLKKGLDVTKADGKEQVWFGLQPLPSIHLEDEVVGNALYTSPKKLYLMLALSLLVICVACINFITLSTSQAMGRMKEIGVRKTLGALKGQLRRQLVTESIFVCFLSSIIGLGMARFVFSTFRQLLDSSLSFSIGWAELGFLILLIALIGWITGSLQSAIIVRKRIGEALTGAAVFPVRKRLFNEGLIVLQFSMSIILIIGAITIGQQMKFIQEKDLGFNEERLLEISLGSTADVAASKQLIKRFSNLALQNKDILSVGGTMNNAREPWTELIIDQTDGSKESIFYNQIDEAYVKTMDITLAEGIDFREDKGSAGNALLVNESLVQHFGWEDPFSQQIPGKNFEEGHQIIGVVKDFHFSSLHQKIEPLVLALDSKAIVSGITGLSTYVWPPNLYQILIRVGPGDLQPMLDHLESSWKAISPDKAFSYHFVDEALEAKYAEEERWAKVMDWASVFAIVIAWLGLLSLMQLSIKKRIKEVGIRKVLGSSTSGILVLLSKRFFLLVGIGSIIAWPIAWILMRKWLESFDYRITLNPFLFLLVGLAVLLLTLSFVWLQSIRAAKANPVRALRFE